MARLYDILLLRFMIWIVYEYSSIEIHIMYYLIWWCINQIFARIKKLTIATSVFLMINHYDLFIYYLLLHIPHTPHNIQFKGKCFSQVTKYLLVECLEKWIAIRIYLHTCFTSIDITQKLTAWKVPYYNFSKWKQFLLLTQQYSARYLITAYEKIDIYAGLIIYIYILNIGHQSIDAFW